MSNNEIDDYASRLRLRRQIETQIQHQREDLEGRTLYLTPTGDEYKGIGTNDTDRKNVIAKRCAGDAVCCEISQSIRALELELSRVVAEIDAYEARRRNDEWITTKMLAEALHERFVGRNPAPTVAIMTAVAESREEAALELQEDPIPF